MSEQTDAVAILAAINAQFTAPRAFEITDPAVPDLTTDHILVVTNRRYVEHRRSSGEVSIPGARVVTRYVAKYASNLRNLRAKTTAALEDQILTGDVGPFTFETADPPEPDGEWLVADDHWTY